VERVVPNALLPIIVFGETGFIFAIFYLVAANFSKESFWLLL
jgi:hypothetical protein